MAAAAAAAWPPCTPAEDVRLLQASRCGLRVCNLPTLHSRFPAQSGSAGGRAPCGEPHQFAQHRIHAETDTADKGSNPGAALPRIRACLRGSPLPRREAPHIENVCIQCWHTTKTQSNLAHAFWGKRVWVSHFSRALSARMSKVSNAMLGMSRDFVLC